MAPNRAMPAEAGPLPIPRRHLLTVALEDYYHVGAFQRVIQRRQWDRFESRLERNTQATLELLDEYRARATFFVLGWVAEAAPELVRLVVERGHEVACGGYHHRSVRGMTPDEFRDDLTRAREAIERATGVRVAGYRVAEQWLTPSDLWVLDVLAQEGLAYDSSVAPLLRRFAAEPWRRFPYRHRVDGRMIWEFPISTVRIAGWSIPIAGGNYFRQLPASLVRRAVARWDRRSPAPFLMYFHVWELDPCQPRISAAPWYARVRHYRNLGRMADMLRYFLSRYPFTGIAEHLGLAPQPALAAGSSPGPVAIAAGPPGAAGRPERRRARRVPITIVVPCYNEELTLAYLANTLRRVEQALESRYRVHYVLVDDGSSDGTWAALRRLFGAHPRCRLERHTVNRGIAAAIMTGIRAASTEIVCSIDCDCSYDPLELVRMIPLLGPDVAMVTASPYHRRGAVANVPRWRLALSRGLSRLYRLVLPQKLATYTSCFRVYRRSRLLSFEPRRPGFLGVAEMVGRLALAGERVAEHPATLEVRLLGRSKLRVLRTIVGHLGLLAELAGERLRSVRVPVAPALGPVEGAPALVSHERVVR